METQFGKGFVRCICGVQKYNYYRPHVIIRDLFVDSDWCCDGCVLMQCLQNLCNSQRITPYRCTAYGFPPNIKFNHHTSVMRKSAFHKWFLVSKYAIEANVYKDVKLYIISILANVILNLKNGCYFKALERIRNLVEDEPVLTCNVHSLKRAYHSYTGRLLHMENRSTDSKRQTYITEKMKQHAIRRELLLKNFGNLLKNIEKQASFIQ